MEKPGAVVSPSLVSKEVASLQYVRIKGGKEDAFFDCRAWLDSDLEEDFFSVNGDFTPWHDNYEAAVPDGSPASTTEAGKRKKLGEHFRETIIGGGRVTDEEDNSRVKPRTHVLVYPNKSVFGAPKRPTSAHWMFREGESKSARSSGPIRRCLERFALCRPSRGGHKKVCSSIVVTNKG